MWSIDIDRISILRASGSSIVTAKTSMSVMFFIHTDFNYKCLPPPPVGYMRTDRMLSTSGFSEVLVDSVRWVWSHKDMQLIYGSQFGPGLHQLGPYTEMLLLINHKHQFAPRPGATRQLLYQVLNMLVAISQISTYLPLSSSTLPSITICLNLFIVRGEGFINNF